MQTKNVDPNFCDTEDCIKTIALLTDHVMDMYRWMFKFFKFQVDIPVELEYPLAILGDILLVWNTFRYCRPDEIKINLKQYLQQPKSLITTFVSPVGLTIADWRSVEHRYFFNRKGETKMMQHGWYNGTFLQLKRAVAGISYKEESEVNENGTPTGRCFSFL